MKKLEDFNIEKIETQYMVGEWQQRHLIVIR